MAPLSDQLTLALISGAIVLTVLAGAPPTNFDLEFASWSQQTTLAAPPPADASVWSLMADGLGNG